MRMETTLQWSDMTHCDVFDVILRIQNYIMRDAISDIEKEIGEKAYALRALEVLT